MQKAAKTNRFLTGCSSKVDFADTELVVNHGDSIHRLVVSHLAQTVCSQDAFLKLTNALIHFAEQSYTLRDSDELEEIGMVLMRLPVDAARQIGLYYQALAINRKGQRREAEALLKTVADNAPITYRARAIQTLGTNYNDNGQSDEALKFQSEALRVAADRNASGLQTTLMALLEISHIRSDTDDHKGAIAILENVWPLVHEVAKQKSFYFYLYHNELAIELGELGRVAEAEAVLKIALASPYASAYPNWAETRQELAAKRTSATPSVVAISRAPEVSSSRQAEPQPHRATSPILAFNWLACDTHSFQIASIPIPATARSVLNATSTLDRVLICIGPRAPPASF